MKKIYIITLLIVVLGITTMVFGMGKGYKPHKSTYVDPNKPSCIIKWKYDNTETQEYKGEINEKENL